MNFWVNEFVRVLVSGLYGIMDWLVCGFVKVWGVGTCWS